ncbi:MAG TPA: hypothetical protein VFT30_07865, partial [Nitrospira sp.]|nr:hypothetical protein [Nitrospira sp.]
MTGKLVGSFIEELVAVCSAVPHHRIGIRRASCLFLEQVMKAVLVWIRRGRIVAILKEVFSLILAQ